MSKWKPTARAEVIQRRTYSRPLDNGEFETWEQVVDRVVQHQRWLWERALGDVPLSDVQMAELDELRALMLDRKAAVSGRTLWLGGTEISRRREASQFNCSFTRVETVHDLVDCFWLLLQGCGVGFRPVTGSLSGFTKPAEIEVIRSQRHKLVAQKGRDGTTESLLNGVWTVTIGDSAEAWAKSIGKLVAQKKPLHKIVLDFSQIRPAGYRLKGYGWISSGDETFSKAMVEICKIMNRKAGQLLGVIDLVDVMNWLGTTLSSRRSAEIAIVPYGSPEWEEFAVMKLDHWKNNPQRSMSNNSIVFYQHPGREGIKEIFKLMEAAGGSEPGFINAEAALKRAPWFSGANPCVEILLANKGFCVDGNTKLITREGITTIKAAVGEKIEIWNGQRWAEVSPFKTSDASKLLRVRFGDGSYLDVTEYHRFYVRDRFGETYNEVHAKDLVGYSKYQLHTEPFTMIADRGEEVDHAYTIGFYVGDGDGNRIDVYGQAKQALPLVGNLHPVKCSAGWRLTDLPFDWQAGMIMKQDLTPVFSWSRNSIIKFVSGLADADGSNTSNGAIRIYQGSESFCRDLQLLLTKVGIRSSVNFMTDKNSNYGKRIKSMWYVQITDTREMQTHRLTHTYEGGHSGKGKWQNINSVEQLEGLHETFCFNEPETTKGVFGNTLTGQCNLVEINLARFNGDLANLHHAVYLMGRANYRQTCVNLQDGILQRAWHENNEFLRLCGVGVTGVVGWENQHDPAEWTRLGWMATYGADTMAKELGLPKAKNVTCVKPSGTLSKVMDTTEGAHKPLGRYIFNNVRFSIHDPYVDQLKAAGYKVITDPYNSDGCLVTFPVDNSGIDFDEVDGRYVNMEPAITQLNRYKMLMDNYVDQNCSVTISYDLDEVPAMIDWLDTNWDTLVGVSFLYRTDPTKTAQDLGYPYLPQEVIEEDVFWAYANQLKPLNREDSIAAQPADTDFEVDAGSECAGGVCPIR